MVEFGLILEKTGSLQASKQGDAERKEKAPLTPLHPLAAPGNLGQGRIIRLLMNASRQEPVQPPYGA